MKVLYVTTLAITINTFMIPHIRMLVEEGNHVDVACNIDVPINMELRTLGCNVINVLFSRSPLSKDNIEAYKRLKEIIYDGNYDIVHCHTPNAAVITRLASRKLRRKGLKVFYTAHGFHFYNGASLMNWIIYYPLEWLCAHWTDTLITINKEDYIRAKKRFHTKRTVYVPGVGLNVDKFKGVTINRDVKRAEIGVPDDAILLLSVGELNANKNHKTVIRALAGIERADIHYVIIGKGDLEDHLKRLASELCIADRIHILGYRTDVAELYKVADVFVHPSFREGLPVSVMEAMASGLPVICSDIRGNKDLICDGKGGFLVRDMSTVAYANHISRLSQKRDLRLKMGKYNKLRIVQYSIKTICTMMMRIYEDSASREKVI